MMRRPKQRSKGELSGEYPGRLGKRRAPTEEQKLREGMALLLPASVPMRSALEQEAAAAVDAIANADYYDEGIALVVKQLGVRSEFHGIRATGGYFWEELALKLLQRHVPYFMAPAQRGAPSTLQSLFPMLEEFIRGIKRDGDAMSVIREDHMRFAERTGATLNMPPVLQKPARWTVQEAYVKVAKMARCKPETVKREFAKWRRSRPGGNFSK